MGSRSATAFLIAFFISDVSVSRYILKIDGNFAVLSNPITKGRSRSHKVEVSSSSNLTCKGVSPIFRVMMVVVSVLFLIIYHFSQFRIFYSVPDETYFFAGIPVR
jgi:hypothetical protein